MIGNCSSRKETLSYRRKTESSQKTYSISQRLSSVILLLIAALSLLILMSSCAISKPVIETSKRAPCRSIAKSFLKRPPPLVTLQQNNLLGFRDYIENSSTQCEAVSIDLNDLINEYLKLEAECINNQ